MRRLRAKRGFTMIELMLVMVVIVMIMGIALPQLWPVIAFAGLEGQASHLGNYGRAAIAECALMRERFIVKIDLADQRYWCERAPMASLTQTFKGGDKEPLDPLEPLNPEQIIEGDSEVNGEERAILMRKHMQAFARAALEVQAANVEFEKEGFLDDIGPEFKEFDLDVVDEEDPIVRKNLLEPVSLPSDVRIESVRIGDKTFTQGTVEIEILPLGLTEHAVFYLIGTDGDYYTVLWDAITGGARLYDGKEENP
jgi:prepilin-type N-terminal cleavage/methylation domain-containing protein